ncbi:MAG: alternative ribosome rescue aminoacyl-tRNA hydrolase ArfB [Actinomycetota bacterium]
MVTDDGSLEVTARVRVPERELSWRFAPSGGPGGQHANTSNTRAELTFNVARSIAFSDAQRERLLKALGAVVTVVADDTRSQTRNRELARQRLAERLRGALHVPKARKATRPSKRARQRRVDDKRRRSRLKANRSKPDRED